MIGLEPLEIAHRLLLAAAAVAACAGLWLLAAPRGFLRANAWLGRWYSTQRALHPLERPIAVERPLYRHHRLLGALLTAGSLYATWRLATAYDEARLVAALRPELPAPLAGALLTGWTVFLLLGNLAALAAGIAVLVRPSALKGLEAWANRWISTRRALRFLDVPRGGPDRLVARHPRLTGALLLAAALWLAAAAWLVPPG